ncbi:hypothetical protein AB0395_21990 [Streptosporangium sp. NPDC051023]|uniref:hypothetical protein n=1 Tax=Streptosporangium sp. NPDC051023 TaxID=3155410 RepID=UPI00344BE66D
MAKTLEARLRAARILLYGAGGVTLTLNVWHSIRQLMGGLDTPPNKPVDMVLIGGNVILGVLAGALPVFLAGWMPELADDDEGWVGKVSIYVVTAIGMILSLKAQADMVEDIFGAFEFAPDLELKWLFPIAGDVATFRALNVILHASSRTASHALTATAPGAAVHASTPPTFTHGEQDTHGSGREPNAVKDSPGTREALTAPTGEGVHALTPTPTGEGVKPHRTVLGAGVNPHTVSVHAPLTVHASEGLTGPSPVHAGEGAVSPHGEAHGEGVHASPSEGARPARAPLTPTPGEGHRENASEGRSEAPGGGVHTPTGAPARPARTPRTPAAPPRPRPQRALPPGPSAAEPPAFDWTGCTDDELAERIKSTLSHLSPDKISARQIRLCNGPMGSDRATEVFARWKALMIGRGVLAADGAAPAVETSPADPGEASPTLTGEVAGGSR